MIKVVLLKNGGLNDYLIGVVEELDEEPSLFIQDCFKIVDDQLEVYPKYSGQRDLFLTSESIFTIVDPSATMVELYESTVPAKPPAE
tara:strand:- start:1377 stop:1637 length:261 start_codon:yes stop_codon:yes gene_type:complete